MSLSEITSSTDLDAFMYLFSPHLLSCRGEFDGAATTELEQLASHLHELREEEPMPEEKKGANRDVQRKFQDSRELATLAWLWAANASLILADEPKKFHKFLANAVDEFFWEEFYEEGPLLEHMQGTAEVLEFLASEANRNTLYTLLKSPAVSGAPKFYALGAQNISYGEEAQDAFFRQALKYITEHSNLLGTPVPTGTKKQTMVMEADKLLKESSRVNEEWDKLGRVKKAIQRRKFTERRKTITAKYADVQKQMDTYDPIDDADLPYENKNGRVGFIFGDHQVEFFDLLMPGNRMVFEARVWRNEKKGKKAKSGRLDMCVKAEQFDEIRKDKADYGTCPIAFNSDVFAWDFKHPYKEHPGMYRRNALGWIIKKA